MKKIAFIGIRGIPVVYSGFESFVEDLTSNLAGEFDFYVYCRKRYIQKKKSGQVALLYIPTIYIYKLETFVHSLLSTLHATLSLRPDVIFYLSVGNAIFLPLARFFGIKAIINVNGMDWDREKWGKFGKAYLRFSAWCAITFASEVVTDSLYSQEYYKKIFGKKTTYIPYMSGGYQWKEDLLVLKKYGLKKNKYIVWAGRLVPDNHLDELLRAYNKSHTKKRLVVIGDDNYPTLYRNKILKTMAKNNQIISTGFIPRNHYLTIVKNAYIYVETKRSGGTHPTLLDAIRYTRTVICINFIANKQVGGKKLLYYKNDRELVQLISKSYKNRSIQNTEQIYSSSSIRERYSNLFMRN